MPLSPDTMRIAIHEAGHAVADILLGLPLQSVSLKRERKIAFVMENGTKVPQTLEIIVGVKLSGGFLNTLNRELLAGKLDLRYAIAAMAGPEAEARFVGKLDDEALSGAQTDIQNIVAACRAAIAKGKPIESWTPSIMESGIIGAIAGEARQLVRDNWSAVVAAANGLLRRRRLSRNHVMAMMVVSRDPALMDGGPQKTPTHRNPAQGRARRAADGPMVTPTHPDPPAAHLAARPHPERDTVQQAARPTPAVVPSSFPRLFLPPKVCHNFATFRG